jgi:predicted PurR-regulated permease PerM
MLGISRKAARYTWSAAVVLVGLWLLYTVRSTLFMFVVALLFAYLLWPLVNVLDRALPGTRARGFALALAYMIFIGAMVLVATQIGSRVVDQAQALSKKLPEMLEKWETPSATQPANINDLKAQIVQNVRNELARRANDLVHLLPAAGAKLVSVASDLVFVVIVPILAFFFMKDSEAIRLHILGLVEAGRWRSLADSLLDDIHRLLAHYMRALVLLSLATFTAYSVFFTIMGVPFGVLLAVIAMLLEFIPMIGPLTAAVVIVIVAAVSSTHVLAVILFLAAYRMFQDYVLSPHLMGQGVELHPLIVLFGVFAGAEVAGIAGSFLSVPLMALARVFYLHIRRSRLSAPAPAAAAPAVPESPLAR